MRKKVTVLIAGAGVLGLGLASAFGTLTHWYSFNGTLEDHAGGVDATLQGNAALAGGQLVLDGDSSTVASLDPVAIAINTYSALTIEFWATPNSSIDTSFHTTVGYGDINPDDANQPHNYVILQTHRLDDVSRAAIALHTPPDTDPWTEETGVNGVELNDDMEHHYVSVIDATDIYWYQDGVLQGSTPLGANSLSGIGDDFFWIGDGYPGDPNWAGTVNELRIYDHAFSGPEVSLHYELGTSAIPEPSTLILGGLGLVALIIRRLRG